MTIQKSTKYTLYCFLSPVSLFALFHDLLFLSFKIQSERYTLWSTIWKLKRTLNEYCLKHINKYLPKFICLRQCWLLWHLMLVITSKLDQFIRYHISYFWCFPFLWAFLSLHMTRFFWIKFSLSIDGYFLWCSSSFNSSEYKVTLISIIKNE